MASRYVSASGSNTSPYDTWAKAATALQTAITGSAANDVFYVDSALSDTATSNRDLTYPSATKINPLIFISVDKTGDPEPPAVTDYLRGATYGTTTGTYNIILTDNDCGAVFIGFEFTASNDISFSHSGIQMTLIDCGLTLTGTNGADKIQLAATAGCVHFIGCDFDFGAAAQGCHVAGRSVAKFEDCAIKSGSAAITGFIEFVSAETQICSVRGFDCTNAGATFEFLSVATLSTPTSGEGQHYHFSGIKLPIGGAITGTSVGDAASVIEWYSCGSASGEIQALGKKTVTGDVSDDTGVLLDRTSDGTNKYSIAMTCNDKTRAGFRGNHTLRFLLAEVFLSSTSATITAHAIEDNATAALSDELWIEVEYPDATDEQLTLTTDTLSSGYLLGTATAVTTEADPGWTGVGGFTNPNYYAPSVSPGNGIGVARVYAVIAFGATRTVYFEPGVEIT